MAGDTDPGDTGWQPPVDPKPSPPSGPPGGGHGSGGPGRVVGEARGVQARSEQDPTTPQRQFTVVTFRLERYDQAGNRLAPVAGEMRGRTFQGVVSEGDWVEVAGGKVRDGTLMVDRVQNLTTNAVVRAKDDPEVLRWIVVGVMVLIVAVVLLVAILIISTAIGGSGPPF